METESSEVSSNWYLQDVKTEDKTSILDEGLDVVLRPLFFSQPESNDILQQLIAEIIDHGPETGHLTKFNSEKRDIKRQQVPYGDKHLLHSLCGNQMDINT